MRRKKSGKRRRRDEYSDTSWTDSDDGMKRKAMHQFKRASKLKRWGKEKRQRSSKTRAKLPAQNFKGCVPVRRSSAAAADADLERELECVEYEIDRFTSDQYRKIPGRRPKFAVRVGCAMSKAQNMREIKPIELQKLIANKVSLDVAPNDVILLDKYGVVHNKVTPPLYPLPPPPQPHSGMCVAQDMPYMVRKTGKATAIYVMKSAAHLVHGGPGIDGDSLRS